MSNMAVSLTTTIPIEPTLNLKLRAGPYPPSKNPPMNVPASLRFQNMRLDPSRALEPARKKLTTVEAQRVMAVFEETIRRVEIVTLLPYIMANLDRYRVSLGGELVELLKHHSVVISSYDDIRRELDNQLERRAAMQKSPAPSEDAEKGATEGQDELDEELADAQREAPDGNDMHEEGPDGNGMRQGSANSMRSAGEQSTDSQMEATMRNLSLVAQQMSHSTRNILRAFTLNPAIMTVITGT